MRTRLTFGPALTALTVGALLALTGCSSSGGDDKAAPPATTSPAPASPSPTAATLATTPTADRTGALPTGIPSAPTGGARVAYLAVIRAVDPALVADPDKAVEAGRNQCGALIGGAANPDHLAAERFGSDAHPITDAEGGAINIALRATLCHA